MIITLLSPVGSIGGAERVLLSWAEFARHAFPEARFTAILLADGPLRNRLQNIGVDVDVVPMPSALNVVGDSQFNSTSFFALAKQLFHCGPRFLQYLHELRKVLVQHRPTLIHSHGLKTHLLACLARPAKVPVIWHLHDFYSERPVAKWAIKGLRRNCTLAVAISEAVRRDFAHLLPGISCVTVRNTTDVAYFAPVGEVANLDVLSGLTSAPLNTARVGLVATYANWKGHTVFLNALSRLPATPAVRAYIIGGPIYQTAGSQVSRQELEQQVVKLGMTGNVGFVPFQIDPAPTYRALDIVVHASTRPEPFGLTIAEAMSCGRPVVVSAAGGATELFRDGVNAVGFQPGNVWDLSNCIAKLTSDPSLRDRLSQEARLSALRDFSTNRLPAEIEFVYRKAIR